MISVRIADNMNLPGSRGIIFAGDVRPSAAFLRRISGCKRQKCKARGGERGEKKDRAAKATGPLIFLSVELSYYF
jgi:hypothetical protein